MSGGSSGGTSSTVAQTAPNAAFTSAYQQLLQQAQGVAAAPLTQTPPGANSSNYVAPLTAQQNQAAGIVQNAQGVQVPYLNAASQSISASQAPLWNGVQQFSPQAVQQYESPYTSDVLNATEASEANTDAQQQQQVVGNAISAGAWGGDRSAVAQGILGGQQALANNQTNANILNTGYTNAQGEFNTQQQAQLGANEANSWLNSQAGSGYANLGNEALGTTLSGASALLGTGALQQNQTQQELNIPLELQQAQQAYPFQTTGWLSGIAEGTGAASGGTGTTTQSYDPNIASELVGGAASTVGILGATGAFGSNGYLTGASGLFSKDGGAIPERYRGGIVVPFRRREGGPIIRRDVGGGVPFLDPSIYSSMVSPVNLNINQTAGAPGIVTPKSPTSATSIPGTPVLAPGVSSVGSGGGNNGGVSGQPGVGATPAQGAAIGDPNSTAGQIGFAAINAMSPFGSIATLASLAGVPVPTMMGLIGHAINGPAIGTTGVATSSGSDVGGGAANNAGDNGPGIGGTGKGTASGSDVGGGAANGGNNGGVSSGVGGVSSAGNGSVGTSTGGVGQGGSTGAGTGEGPGWQRGGSVGIMAGLNDNNRPNFHRATGTGGIARFADGGGPTVNVSRNSTGIDVPMLGWGATPSMGTPTSGQVGTSSDAPIITPSPISAPPAPQTRPVTMPTRPGGVPLPGTASGQPGSYYQLGNGMHPTTNGMSLAEAIQQHAGVNGGPAHRANGGIMGYDDGGDVNLDPIEPVSQVQMLGDASIPQGADQYTADLAGQNPGGIARAVADADITPQPSGGIAAIQGNGRWSPDYNPKTPVDRAGDIRKMAPWLALISGGAGALAGHGTGLQNLGAGLNEGLKTFAGQEGAANQAEQQQEQQTDTNAYRKNTLQSDAQRLNDAADEAKKRAAQTDAAQLETGRHNAADESARTAQLQQTGDIERQRLAMEATAPDVKTAQWLSTATDEQKKAYYDTLALKSGLPPGMIGAQPGTGTGGPTGTDALNVLPDAQKATVQAMIEGRMAPPTGMAMTKPYWQNMIAAANRVDPSFDQTTWSSRVGTRRDFTSGASAKNLTSINTALGHAGVLSDSFDQLGNTDIPFVNTVKNWALENTGDARPTNTREAVDALASESRKVFAGTGGGGLAELEQWQKNFPIDGSPDQQKGALKQLVQLYDSRIDSMGEQYSRGMGKAEDGINLLSPKAKDSYQKLTGQQPESDRVLGSKGQSQSATTSSAQQQSSPTFAVPTPPPQLAKITGLQWSPGRKQFKDPSGNLYGPDGGFLGNLSKPSAPIE